MKHIRTTAALLTATAFANADTTAAKRGAPKAEDRIAPVFTTVRTDVPLPVGATARSGNSPYAAEFAKLTEVNMSFGLANKTKEQISSIVSRYNNAADNQRAKLNADGTPVTKNGDPITDQTGTVIGYKQVPVTERIVEYKAFNVDPKKDPDKATVRIFRVK